MAYTAHLTNASGTGIVVTDATTAIFTLGGYEQSGGANAQVNMPFRTGNGVFSYGGVYISQNDIGSASFCTLRVDNVSVALNISITANTTGLFVDEANSVSVNADSVVNWLITATAVGGTHTITVKTIFCRFLAATNTYQRLISSKDSSSGNQYGSVTTNFIGLGSYLYFGGLVEANAAYKYRTDGTMQKLDVHVSANTRDSATVIKSRKNAADGTLTVSITASTTGLFSDTSNTDTITSGDTYCFQIAGAVGTGTGTFSFVSSEFLTTNKKSEMYSVYPPTDFPSAASQTSYFALTSGHNFAVAETQFHYKAGFPTTVTNLKIYCSANAMTTNGTFDFRVATASTSLTISVTALTTGLFEDTTHSVSLAVGDLCNYRFVSGATGGATIEQFGCLFLDATSSGTTFPGYIGGGYF